MLKLSFSGDLCVAKALEKPFAIDLWVHDYDINFVCLEAPWCRDNLNPFPKTGLSLRQHEDVESILKSFQYVTLANNHIMDYGIEGFKETVIHLEELGIKYAGCATHFPDMYTPIVIEQQGIRVAVFCLAEAQFGCCKGEYTNKGGYGWMLNPIVLKQIQEYKKKTDHVIMYLHGGLECEDYPLLEWREVYHSFIDFGADLIIASHPHVIQGKECYKGRTIYYSLGNLFFNNDEFLSSKNTTTSLIVECDISTDRINTTEHFVEFDNESIHQANFNAKTRFEKLSNILLPENEEDYIRINNEMVISCWERYYMSYYSFPIFKSSPVQNRILRKLYHIRRDLLKKGIEESVSLNHMYHNVNIDTHRFVVSRACSLLSDTY